jgi:hypothetical protein
MWKQCMADAMVVPKSTWLDVGAAVAMTTMLANIDEAASSSEVLDRVVPDPCWCGPAGRPSASTIDDQRPTPSAKSRVASLPTIEEKPQIIGKMVNKQVILAIADHRRPVQDATDWLGPQSHPDAPTIGRATAMVAYGPIDPPPPIAAPALPPPRQQEWACTCHADQPATIWHWMTIHNEFGCDDQSCQDLYNLSQRSIGGFYAANMIIGKMLKSVCADTRHGNRSAFLGQCVKNAIPKVDAADRAAWARQQQRR